MPAPAPIPRAQAPRRWLGLHRRQAKWGVLAAVVVALGIHVALPALAGIEHSLRIIRDGDLLWILAAALCSGASLGCYIGVFKLVVGHGMPRLGWVRSYQVAMASQGASTIVTAGGAGGLALFVWALPRLGLERERVPERIVAFLAFHYAIYLGAIVIFGFAFGSGLLSGPAPGSLTLLPATIAAIALVLAGLAARRSPRLQRALDRGRPGEGRLRGLAHRLVGVPAAAAAGLGYATSLLHPTRRGWLISGLALGYWATNIAILECCFLAFGVRPDVGGLILAFFIGSTANLLPLLPGGVGSAEAGLIGALLAFGEPGAQVVVAVLSFRLLGYWIPTVPEAIAYVQIRRALGPG